MKPIQQGTTDAGFDLLAALGARGEPPADGGFDRVFALAVQAATAPAPSPLPATEDLSAPPIPTVPAPPRPLPPLPPVVVCLPPQSVESQDGDSEVPVPLATDPVVPDPIPVPIPGVMTPLGCDPVVDAPIGIPLPTPTGTVASNPSRRNPEAPATPGDIATVPRPAPTPAPAAGAVAARPGEPEPARLPHAPAAAPEAEPVSTAPAELEPEPASEPRAADFPTRDLEQILHAAYAALAGTRAQPPEEDPSGRSEPALARPMGETPKPVAAPRAAPGRLRSANADTSAESGAPESAASDMLSPDDEIAVARDPMIDLRSPGVRRVTVQLAERQEHPAPAPQPPARPVPVASAEAPPEPAAPPRGLAAAVRGEPVRPLESRANEPAPLAPPAALGGTVGAAEADGTATAAPAPSSRLGDERPVRNGMATDRVTVHLSDEAGGARVQIAVRGDQVNARIVAPDATGGRELEKGLGELRSALARHGFAESQVQVEVARPGDGAAAVAARLETAAAGESRQQDQQAPERRGRDRQHDDPRSDPREQQQGRSQHRARRDRERE